MGNPKKSKDKMNYELVSDYHEHSFQHELANIIINGTRTKYFIRDDGKVFSSNHSKPGKLKERKISKDKKTGYSLIHFSVNNKSYTKLVHRLVAEAFIPNLENKPEVNHKNGKKNDNDVTNLEWATEKENIQHAYKLGLNKSKCGEDRHNSKITRKQAILICKLLEENKLTYKEISKKAKCTKSIVRNIRNKKCWNEVSINFDIDNHDVKESTNGNLRLNKKEVEKICEKLESGFYTIRDISKIHNVPYSKVNDIKQRKTWTKVSKKFDFSNYKKYI